MTEPTVLPAKITARIRIDEETGCWLWTGCTNNGYGATIWPPKTRRRKQVHRLVWELLRGPIPDGMVPDHLCRIRLCVNPAHLEIVTVAENTRRGSINRGWCRAGLHPWEPSNIITHLNGSQRCRECARSFDRERNARRTAAGLRRKARPGSGQAPLF